ncbi:hypothetical protein CEXT_259381 [Caerostris extrusa]|uniref:Uncharacterized protein n=1 Tax=Caerostris extrusa TaxID=172846 RepID=A0AAV4M4Z7_CAEEX|nr:hypothetical protein CEXT_259381 [Caerostris extrusa]
MIDVVEMDITLRGIEKGRRKKNEILPVPPIKVWKETTCLAWVVYPPKGKEEKNEILPVHTPSKVGMERLGLARVGYPQKDMEDGILKILLM